MIVDTRALWGDEPTPERPATYTVYLADQMPETARPKRPCAIVVGGGAFQLVAKHEQEPVALEFLARGFQAVTLDYVTNETGDVSYPNPEADLARMVATVRANAEEWNIDSAKVVVVGFSAGGHICATLATRWKKGPFMTLAEARPEDIRPDAVVLGYPLLDLRIKRDEQLRDPRIDLRVPKTGGKTGRDLLNEYFAMLLGADATEEAFIDFCPTTHVSRDMPPTFAWAASDDRTCPVSQLYDFASAMARERVVNEVHVFDRGGHGLSVANGNTATADNADRAEAVRAWVPLAIDFLARQGIA